MQINCCSSLRAEWPPYLQAPGTLGHCEKALRSGGRSVIQQQVLWSHIAIRAAIGDTPFMKPVLKEP